MHATSFHTHTCTNRIYAVIKALDSYLGTFSRHAGNLANGNQSVIDFRHLSLKQTFKEHRTCTRKDNLRIVVLVVYTQNNGTNSLALAIDISRNLLTLRKNQLVVLIVNDKHLTLPNLINLTRNNLSYAILVFIIERIVLQFQYLWSQRLTKI